MNSKTAQMLRRKAERWRIDGKEKIAYKELKKMYLETPHHLRDKIFNK